MSTMSGRTHLLLLSLAALLAGCSEPPASNIPANISPNGNSLAIRADMPLNPDAPGEPGIVALSAAAYVDATRQMIVGGDVFSAEAGSNRVLLQIDDEIIGNYEGSLANVDASTPLTVAIEYAALESAAKRWFTSQQLVTDPGAGPLVGTTASLTFPPALAIALPAANQAYRNIDDTVHVTWTPPAAPLAGDTQALAWAHNCVGFSPGSLTGTRAIPATAALAGAYDIRVDEILLPATPGDVINDIFFGVMFTLVSITTGGLIEPLPPVEDDPSDGCVIRITLFSERNHPLPAGFVGGAIVSSRSDTRDLRYIPAP